MNGHLVQVGFVFLTLKTHGGVLFVLGGDIAGDAGDTALALFGAFENDLNPVTFCFLCHRRTNLKLHNLDEAFRLRIFKGSVEAVLLNVPHTFARHLEGNETLLGLRPEPFVLEVDREDAFGASFRMGNIVSDHSRASCYLTNLCHNYLSFTCFFQRGCKYRYNSSKKQVFLKKL